MGQPDLTSEELKAIIDEIRDRVHARYPEGQAHGLGVALPDYTPLLHARDAAEGKSASIGTVNPRPGGLLNAAIQRLKRLIARGLGWFVRDQIDFNRATIAALNATLESLASVNRTFVAVGARLAVADELKDIRVHWHNWRQEWETKLLNREIEFLRAISDLRTATEIRVREAEATLQATERAIHSTQNERDAAYRESLRLLGSDMQDDLRKASDRIQQTLWADMHRFRLEYEEIIHSELRLLRQRARITAAHPGTDIATPSTARTNSAGPPSFDYLHFASRFRGPEEQIRERLQVYVPYLANRTHVLDIGCGRGEFLQVAAEAGARAQGIDLDRESVELCRQKGLSAETADLFEFLPGLPDRFDLIFASQVIEHLPPERLPDMLRLCYQTLKRGGLLILETPNPECLAIFATHFYIDPTHTRPIPPALAAFYLEELGFGRVEVKRLSPAIDSMPSVAELPPAFRDTFFGGLDYAIIGTKL